MTVPNANKLRSLALALIGGGLVVAVAALAYLFFTPKLYRASTRIKLNAWVQSLPSPMDLSRMPGECQALRSNSMLDPVIKDLNLAEHWEKRYHPGSPLGAEEVRERLHRVLSIRPLPDSALIEIAVTSPDPAETSQIANALAGYYLKYRAAQRGELIGNKLAGLNHEWSEQSQKIAEAQTLVDKLYFEISKARSTNLVQLYDPDAYSAVVNDRIRLEGDYIARSNQFEKLRNLSPEERIQVLSTVDDNSALNGPLLQLTRAKSTLLKAQLDHGPESTEVKTATTIVENMNKAVAKTADSVMTVKQTQLDGDISALKLLDAKLAHASTNVATEYVMDANYREALTNLHSLKTERDALQKRMTDVESAEASRPDGITAEIIDRAETPEKPFMPDQRLAASALAAGGILALSGFVIVIISLFPVKVPAKPTV